MIIADEKKAIMTIMAKRHPKDGTATSAPMKNEKSMSIDGEVDGKHAAAEDVIAAMHEKSPHKLREALSNFMDMHMTESQSPDEESED